MHAPGMGRGPVTRPGFFCHLYELFTLFLGTIYAIYTKNCNLWCASHTMVWVLDQGWTGPRGV
jgi:hypothetical protein